MTLVPRLQRLIRRERTRVGFLAATAIITTAGAPQMRDAYPHHVAHVDSALNVSLAAFDAALPLAGQGAMPTAVLGATEGLDARAFQGSLDAMSTAGTTPAAPAPAAAPEAPVADGPKEFPTYVVSADVTLAPNVEAKVQEIAARYHAKTGKRLTVTSGTRSPMAQAKAMHTKLELGDNVIGLYANKGAIREIVAAYEGESGAMAQVAAMAATIEKQQADGVYISRHMREGAVDFRSRDMNASDKRALRDAIEQVSGVDTFIEEHKPPHFHLEVR